MSNTPPDQVDLSNCDQEPIHVPALVQPHGALLAFDLDGRLVWRSANAADWLGADLPALGEWLTPTHLGAAPDVHQFIAAARTQGVDAVARHARVQLGDHAVDLVVHRYLDHVIAEFEHRPAGQDAAPDYSPALHRAAPRGAADAPAGLDRGPAWRGGARAARDHRLRPRDGLPLPA